MKVLLVITGMSMGGAERVVANLADALARGGDEVLVAYLKSHPFEVSPQCPEVRLECLGVDSITDAFPGYLRFRKIVREFKPDVVHSHMFHATMLARLARLSMQVPCLISTAHSAIDGGLLRAMTYRATDRLTDISTNVSREAVNAFVARGAVREGRMIAIYNGISMDEFRSSRDDRESMRRSLGIEPDCKLYLAAGRLSPLKDYPNMFNALARLPADLNFRLLIAGHGALRGELEKLAAKLGLRSRVQFLGIRRDIAALMSAADVFVLSSSAEGFGLVVAEAMACERVVVATDCGGVREVLGEQGYLVPSRDPEALAQALIAASLLGQSEADEIGRAARNRVVDMFSFDRAVERWQQFYGNLVDGANADLNKSGAPG
jgi:glycosyltransferase involved in cell wall biosynthesis